MTDLSARPKVELHLHLDCSLTRAALARLGEPLSEDAFRRRFSAPERCATLLEYLSAIAPSAAVLQSAAALAIATEELIATLAADGVIHAEIRFAPLTHLAGGLTPDAVLEAVVAGLGAGLAGRDMTAGLILCALRDHPPAANLEVIELAQRWRSRGVVGVDLAGDEAAHPGAPHVAAFERAHALGLPITIHAGEAGCFENIIEAVGRLHARRIGHGVRAIDSPELVDALKARDVHLEVCPSSNIQVGVYPDLARHPVDRLSKLGVSLSINTDARTVAPLSLTGEYRRLADVFGWQAGEFLAHNLEAARHAFLPAPDRQRLSGRLVAGWTD